MHHQDAAGDTGPIGKAAETAEKSATSACDALCRQSAGLMATASDTIRKKPVCAVIGAAAFGAVVCYLILSERKESSFREQYLDGPLSDAGAGVSSVLRDLCSNLKFW